jgi:hypothetical protein
MVLMTQRMTSDYLRSLGRLVYLWGWPLVNMHNRLSLMEKMPGPGLLGGIVPAAPPGSVAMLHDYVEPGERLVACPNHDVVYGFGLIDGNRGPFLVADVVQRTPFLPSERTEAIFVGDEESRPRVRGRRFAHADRLSPAS